MYFVYIGISAVVCCIFIHNKTNISKKFTPLGFFQLLVCGLIAVLTTYIFYFYVIPNHQELINIGVVFLSSELLQISGMIAEIPNILAMNIHDLLNPTPSSGQATAPTSTPAQTTPSGTGQGSTPQNSGPQNSGPSQMSGPLHFVQDPRLPGQGQNAPYDPQPNNNNRAYAQAIEYTIRCDIWSGDSRRRNVIQRLDITSRTFYFDWLHHQYPHL